MSRAALFLLLLSGSLSAAECRLLVAAASDLAPLETTLRKTLPGCSVRFAFSSSGTLARQIEAGADYDIFLSANEAFARQVADGGHAGSLTPYAIGRLALWSRAGLAWEELGRAGRIALANPALAPYGLAAKQVLESRGLWEKWQPRIVYAQNVRQAWQFAQSGNADAALVSWTLVKDRGGRLLPADWHPPIRQTAVLPRQGRNPEAARRFLAWLVSPAGQKALAAHGLEPVR